LYNQNICHQAVFYKKEIFALLGLFNLKYKVWADWDLNMRCFVHPDLRNLYVDIIVAKYNNVSGFSSITEVDTLLEKERTVYYIKEFEREKNRILQTKSYRLGKFILTPFLYLRNKI
jgi:hypothetical protein